MALGAVSLEAQEHRSSATGDGLLDELGDALHSELLQLCAVDVAEGGGGIPELPCSPGRGQFHDRPGKGIGQGPPGSVSGYSDRAPHVGPDPL
ncbi:MAG: hypothetical protein WA724_03435 [Candidatus Dormiibacterota bacterium]